MPSTLTLTLPAWRPSSSATEEMVSARSCKSPNNRLICSKMGIAFWNSVEDSATCPDTWSMTDTACRLPRCRRSMMASISVVDSLGPAGQRAHLIGDHGKTAPDSAGPGRLDGGVEGEQIGLLGDGANHRQHRGDFRALGVEVR
jgi:hypothetical protein